LSDGGPIVIGLVGGIGSGKSSVARAFASLGALVYDADRETSKVLAQRDVVETFREWWGDRVVNGDGSVNRREVAQIVFSDEAERERLEGLVHPRLAAARKEVKVEAQRVNAPAVIVDAPLLFEAGIEGECDKVVYVDTPRELRLARVASRGWDGDELDRRERAQKPLDEKRARSDAVIDNSGDEAALRAACEELLARFRAG